LAGKSADYVVTGSWSKRSVKEASALGKINVVASDADNGFKSVPDFSQWSLNPDAAYVHYCTNETINGVEFSGEAELAIPETNGVPIVADMSSHILSRPVDVSNYGVIYGGAQKNIGPAGLCLVIVRDDLLGQADAQTPSVFNWQTQADNNSMTNTPPTYAIYMAGLVFEWLLENGGVKGIEAINKAKAKLLYDYVDSTDFYHNDIQKAYRSRMNVPFLLADEALNAGFLAGAASAGLLQLKGHRSVGGMRASIYNAMPLAGVQALVEYMQAFEQQHG